MNIVKQIYEKPLEKINLEIDSIIKKWNLVPGGNVDIIEKKANKEQYLKFRDHYNSLPNKEDDYSIICLFVLIIFSFNSQIRFNSKNEFNIPYGKQGLNERRSLNLKLFHSAINQKNIKFNSKDYSQIFEEIISNNENDIFVYLDPPYSITNATYNSDWTFEDDKNLFDFLDVLSTRKIKWAMSNVIESNGKVNINLKKWIESNKYTVDYLEFSYKNSNYQRKNKDIDREVIIRNYVN